MGWKNVSIPKCRLLFDYIQLNREIRRRTRVVGTFPDGRSALMLVTARLKYVAESSWGSRRYLDVTLLDE